MEQASVDIGVGQQALNTQCWNVRKIGRISQTNRRYDRLVCSQLAVLEKACSVGFVVVLILLRSCVSQALMGTFGAT